jgi:hypothetical protein
VRLFVDVVVVVVVDVVASVAVNVQREGSRRRWGSHLPVHVPLLSRTIVRTVQALPPSILFQPLDFTQPSSWHAP